MLSQLSYTSARKSNCTDTEITKILESCKENNSGSVTGALVYSQTKFIQYLEGNSKEILRLYDKIKLDDRHEKVMMISYGPIENRLFPNWYMASKEYKEQIELLSEATPNEKKTFEDILNGEAQETSSVVKLLNRFF